jgi:hypothetical protein
LKPDREFVPDERDRLLIESGTAYPIFVSGIGWLVHNGWVTDYIISRSLSGLLDLIPDNFDDALDEDESS